MNNFLGNKIKKADEFFRKKKFFLSWHKEGRWIFSASKTPTTNLYFHNVCMIHLHLRKERNESVIKKICKRVWSKSSIKYWKDYSLVLSIAAVIDLVTRCVWSNLDRLQINLKLLVLICYMSCYIILLWTRTIV